MLLSEVTDETTIYFKAYDACLNVIPPSPSLLLKWLVILDTYDLGRNIIL